MAPAKPPELGAPGDGALFIAAAGINYANKHPQSLSQLFFRRPAHALILHHGLALDYYLAMADVATSWPRVSLVYLFLPWWLTRRSHLQRIILSLGLTSGRGIFLFTVLCG